MILCSLWCLFASVCVSVITAGTWQAWRQTLVGAWMNSGAWMCDREVVVAECQLVVRPQAAATTHTSRGGQRRAAVCARSGRRANRDTATPRLTPQLVAELKMCSRCVRDVFKMCSIALHAVGDAAVGCGLMVRGNGCLCACLCVCVRACVCVCDSGDKGRGEGGTDATIGPSIALSPLFIETIEP